MTTSSIAGFLYSSRRACRYRNTISVNQHLRARCLPKAQRPKKSANKDDRKSHGRPTSTENGQNAKSSMKTPQTRCLAWWIHRLKRRVRRHLRTARHNSPLANTIHCRAWTMSPKVSGGSPNPGFMPRSGLTNPQSKIGRADFRVAKQKERIAWHERNFPGGVPGCEINLADAIAAREALSDTPENHWIRLVWLPSLATWGLAGAS